MKKLKVVVIGAGNRGKTYTGHMKNHGGFEIVGVAEPIPERREYVRKTHNIPEENCFDTYETLLAQPKFADIAIISTSDALHYAPAMMAIEKGYDLLLEKPAAPTAKECADIANAAKEKGVKILVCHVLRYTPYWSRMRQLIEEGKVGEVVSIHHAECVGNEHQSHSYVRGNWGNTAKSSNMLLAKCCHDIDLMQWLVGSKCSKTHSFGSLTYFKRENAPEGSPEYCIEGCPHADTCYYNATVLYSDQRHWKKYAFVYENIEDITPEVIEKGLRTTQFGKCIFKCDNDVVDHQVVNLEFENGATASFNMCAFNKGGRYIRIMGTDGELSGSHGSDTISYFDFKTRTVTDYHPSKEMVDETINGGHGGGDSGIVNALYKYMAEGVKDSKLSEIAISVENHLIVFAAEESRIENTVVDYKEFCGRYLK